MLNANSRKILKFLKKHRPNEYSKAEIMERVHAEHIDETVEQLRIDDYIQRHTGVRDDNIVALYTISDLGMAELEARRELISDRLITRAISLAALIISILALLSQLGILQLPQYSHPEKSSQACGSSSLTSSGVSPFPVVEFRGKEVFFMDQNQAQAAANLFPIIVQALTTIAALLAAFAAFHAASKSSKTAVYQSYFAKKAESYDEYWKAFTAFVFHPNIPDTRRTLIAAMYSACMYASDDTARNIKVHTDIALKRDWMLSNGIDALDSISLEVIDILQRDLQSTDLPDL